MNETQENKQIMESSREEFEKTDIFGVGAPNDGFAQYFVGNSFLKPLTEPGKCPVFLANVTFEPGCRKLAHSPCKRRRWTDFDLYCRNRLVSGMGQRGKRAESGRRSLY